ncbi:MAG: hypothetical protein A2X49_03745 [Lentisphaerae bacterium GWF2_52_8]|nr:MAG: hypothetical protein A2X49_03745 [Lentisphaerae bacterium GWF2_52_8]
MRVLFLIKSAKTPSSRIRVTDILPVLRNEGVEADVEVLPGGFWARQKLFASAKNYPVVILQKRLLNWLDFMILRRSAKILAFDFDDAIYLKNASPATNPADYGSPTRRRLFSRTVSNVNLVIAANRVLGETAKSVAPETPVEIVPSSVDTLSVKVKEDYALSPSPVIGWVGSRSTLRYLEFIAEPLAEVCAKHHAVLHVVSDSFPEISGVKTVHIPWSLHTQYDEIRRFDVGLMPLSPDPFSEGKASYKLLQYLACGVPSVSSPVGMNSDVAGPGQGEFCLKAERPDDFARLLNRLLGDQQLREKLGHKGRRLVEEQYSTLPVGRKLAKILKEVAEHRKAS